MPKTLPEKWSEVSEIQEKTKANELVEVDNAT